MAYLSVKFQRKSIRALGVEIQEIDQQIDHLIIQDQRLVRQVKIATSVPGIGKVTALALIIATNEFQNFERPRQLASYCGVVPFEYTSGKSIKGRPKVHFMANKHLKQLLHLCAMSASRNDPEMRTYFLRKVEEGKSKMLIINNIRNKLIHRVCACLRDERIFEPRMAA